MPRRGSFTSLMYAVARAAARSERERQKLERAKLQEAERIFKQTVRFNAQASKEEKQRYLEMRLRETENINNELKERINELQNILYQTLEVDNSISFSELRINDNFQDFELPNDLQKEPVLTSEKEYFSKIPQPTGLDKLIPGWERRYQIRLQEAKKRYDEYKAKFDAYVIERNKKIANLKTLYDKEKQEFDLKRDQHNQEVNELEVSYKNSEPIAVVTYCTMILERSEYPNDFPQEFRIAYLPAPKELVIEYELPHKNIVPPVVELKYMRTKDSIDEKTRKPSEIKDLYQDIVSAVCLRTIHEVFKADHGNCLDVVTFNGFVNDIDPATGRDIQPCLISIRTTRDKFQEINLAKVDKKACLRNLGAQVSPHPDELMAVKPIVEFDMVDKRFVEESDILTDLESRPNLMELTPFEFENLVNNLFDRIGFDSKSTQASRDGGVDVVAFDPRPILGGKVVIQAKRYKNVVGVSAVRDLYGTMINEGANKGILVATSHYGKDAYEFAKDKPIELIDGGGLLYLLDQNGVKAKIIFPED